MVSQNMLKKKELKRLLHLQRPWKLEAKDLLAIAPSVTVPFIEEKKNKL